MPFINLIEEQRLALRKERAKAQSALFLLGGTTGLSLIACGFLFIAGEVLDGEISTMKREAEKVKPLQEQIDQVNDEIAQMGPKLNTLKSARETTAKWDSILNHLTIQTPKDIYLTSVRCMATDPAKPIQVNFAGISGELHTVGEFILRLQGCDQLEGVALNHTQEKMISTYVGIEFDVMANIAGTAEETKAKDASKEGEQ